MNPARRLELFEDDAPDEELPGYEPRSAPEYESEDSIPLHTFQMLQVDRRHQLLVPLTSSDTNAYKVLTNGVFQRLSKKPDMELLRISPEQMLESSASIRFDNNGPLPWRPRANVSHDSGDIGMESRNFSDWTFTIGNTSYIWQLAIQPMSLVFRRKASTSVIARFIYSQYGTWAANGAAVGELTVYRDGLSVGRAGLETIICGLMVAIIHFKKMGRNYRNDGPVRATSLPGAGLPQQRTLFDNASNL
ncbi:hypothetical protein P154DRAFT_517613 [Amniculicola lignicola CBS 123094]|uniref:Uncharacterized protein n=1 Tax=Amniculicola lignicola CBS 123094 TaxID=1392246 RepID=A0A6A5WXK9_9PLEO|nr:hypothetical protein P154DRAFT_517613 [Amniculicola lignicola CBS 123094]